MSKRPIELNENTITKKCCIETPNLDETAVEIDSLPATSNSIPFNSPQEDNTISKLPVELLEHVFQFLPLRERRNASLVCTTWHEIGSLPKYSLNEKLVFRGYQDFETLILFLSKTKREHLNLEFHQCKFYGSSNLLSIGEKIRSLNFRNCQLNDDFIVKLFIKCDNLKEFCLRRRRKLRYKLGFINLLVKKGFMSKNLEILRLNMYVERLSVDEIDSLINMFPNIKNLPFQEIGWRKPSELRWERTHFKFSDSFSSSLAQRIISKKHTLETLKIFGYENHVQLFMSHNFPRLKRLSLLLGTDIIPDITHFDFIFRLEYLEKLSLHILLFENVGLSNFIVHIIHRCLHLKHLKLTSEYRSSLDFYPKIFEALVSSNLISFKTNDNICLEWNTKAENNNQSLENGTLRALCIPYSMYPEKLTLILSHFKNLKFLELYSTACMFSESETYRSPETALESIGQFRENLTCLKFWSRDFYRDHPTNNKDIAYQAISCLPALTNLVCLDLKLHNYEWLFDCDFVPSSVKYLRLSLLAGGQFLRKKLESGELKNSLLPLRNKKRLESIYFNSKWADLTDVSTWLEICSTLNELHFLCLVNDIFDPLTARSTDDPFSETHTSLFECCPSLRCLVQKFKNQHCLLFYYDHVDGKMKAVRKSAKIMKDYLIPTEVVRGSKIKSNFLPSYF